jgi:outer membrane biosynthesis protein TonB
MRRRRIDPFDRRSMGLSAILHAAIFAVGWASTLYAPTQMVFETYEIELVSPPPAVQATEERQAAEEIVVERPEPEPLPPEPEPEEVVPVEDPEPEPPEPEPEEPAEEMPPEVAEEEVEAASVTEVEEEEAEVSGEDLNVRIEGLRRDYPLYYENIIRQVQRCFVSRWREGGRWETTLFFYIDREGYAEEIQFVKRSGNSAFDYTAMGAVECAGRGVFGPLPEELPFDRFPVRFTFRPQNAPIELVPGGATPGSWPWGITYGPERPHEQTDAQQQESR